MKDAEIEIGMSVEVNLPDGWRLGVVKSESPPYQLSNEKRYEVHGVGKKAFVTIASARSIRKAWMI